MIRTTNARNTKSLDFLSVLLVGTIGLLFATAAHGFLNSDVSFASKSAVHQGNSPLGKFSRDTHHIPSTIQSRQSRFSLAYTGEKVAFSSPSSKTRLYSSSSPSIRVRGVIDWIQGKPLDSLVSKEETVAICRELTGDEALLDSLEQAIVENWDKIVNRLIQSRSDGTKRTLRGLLGEEATERLLRGVQNIDLYSDPKTVNAFLQSDAVNDLFAQTLCKYPIGEYSRRMKVSSSSLASRWIQISFPASLLLSFVDLPILHYPLVSITSRRWHLRVFPNH